MHGMHCQGMAQASAQWHLLPSSATVAATANKNNNSRCKGKGTTRPTDGPNGESCCALRGIQTGELFRQHALTASALRTLMLRMLTFLTHGP